MSADFLGGRLAKSIRTLKRGISVALARLSLGIILNEPTGVYIQWFSSVILTVVNTVK